MPTLPEFVPSTWSEFWDAIRQARHHLGSPSAVWYRGQSSTTHKLIPSLLRRSSGIIKERLLFNEYERSASHLVGLKQNDWETLQDMQHYGIPTRLLDWTDVFGVALAFALYDSNNDSDDSAIFVLDPQKLNEKSGIFGIKRAEDDNKFTYRDVYWNGTPFSPTFPIAIDCRLHNERLRAQRGNFTVHGLNQKALDDQASDALVKIVVCSSMKPFAREFLEYANFNPFSIYPDIVGMAQHITRKHL